ncbi:MAG TPA: substrate-binding domain-containing protein [Streptosporangiaceae bacterium]|jgi:ribose transport system substrate-binding protein
MDPITARPHRRRARRRLLIGAVAVALLASACSSSASPAHKASLSGASSTSSEVQKATAFIKPYLTPPAKIPLSVPLTSPAPRGKTIVFLQCELAQCQVIGASVKQAAAVVGWTYKVIPYQSTNPSTLAAALTQALQYHPVAVGFTSPPYALWSQEVAAYKAAGVALIPSFTGTVPLGPTIVANPASAGFAGLNGQILGNWFIADSGAKGNVLSVNIPDFPYLGDVSDQFDATVASDCPGCKVTDLNVGIPDVDSGAITGIVVSALRRNPAIKYVVASDSAFMEALPAALQAAGLGGKVQVAGCCGVAAVETGLTTGAFSAITGVNGTYAGFLTIDAALRVAEKLPIPSTEGDLPVGLLTRQSPGTPSNSYDEPADYAQQFEKLWKIS